MKMKFVKSFSPLFLFAFACCTHNQGKDAIKFDIQVQELIIKNRKERIAKEKDVHDSIYRLNVKDLEKEEFKLDSLKRELEQYE